MLAFTRKNDESDSENEEENNNSSYTFRWKCDWLLACIHRQCAVGKSSEGMTALGIVLDIVTRGWTNVAFRDEIYIQLCRQTTRNPQLSVLVVVIVLVII